MRNIYVNSSSSLKWASIEKERWLWTTVTCLSRMRLYFKDQKYTGTTIFKSSFLLTQMKAGFNTAPLKPLRLQIFLLCSIYFSIQVQLQSEKQLCKIALNFLESANLLSIPGQQEVDIVLLTHQYYCQLILNVILKTTRLIKIT